MGDPLMLVAAFSVATVYIVLGLACCMRLVLQVRASRSFSWSSQLGFLVLMTLASWLRSAFFFSAPRWKGVFVFVRMDTRSSLDLYVLDELPNFVVLVSYLIIGVWWAQSNHRAVGDLDHFKVCVRPLIFALLCSVLLLQVIVWIGFSSEPEAGMDWSVLGAVASCMGFLLTAVVFAMYGPRLAETLSKAPVAPAQRRKMTRRTRRTALLCAVVFALRAVGTVVAALAQQNSWAPVDTVFSPGEAIVFVLYYALLEILPAAIILFGHTRLSPSVRRRASSRPLGWLRTRRRPEDFTLASSPSALSQAASASDATALLQLTSPSRAHGHSSYSSTSTALPTMPSASGVLKGVV